MVRESPLEDMDLPGPYDAAFIACGSIMLFPSPETVSRVLAKTRSSLSEGGFLLIDSFVPREDIAAGTQPEYRVFRDVEDPILGRCTASEIFETDPETQIKRGTYRYERFLDGKSVEAFEDELVTRWYEEEEFKDLLQNAGFSRVESLRNTPLYAEDHSWILQALR
jgi:hypothetical protein